MTTRKSRRPNHMTPAERAECLRLRGAGLTIDQLCDVFDRGLTTIKNLLRRQKIHRQRC